MALSSRTFAWLAMGLLSVGLVLPASAASITYSVSLKGTTRTLGGQKFQFTGTGTMTVDDQTGDLTFTANLSNGTTLQGTGIAGASPKVFFANINFTQGPANGIGLIDGKIKREGAKITGKFNVGTPDRLGPAPGGFVYSTGRITGLRQ
jgi:hypothetical protein